MINVANADDFVVGADTHTRTDTLCITKTTTNENVTTRTFPATHAGMKRCCSWVGKHTNGRVLAAAEGTRSYGAELARGLTGARIEDSKVKPLRTRSRASAGKSDELDAVAAIHAVLGVPVDRLTAPRSDGPREALRMLLASRRQSNMQRTAPRNALTVLARTHDLGINGRRALTKCQIRQTSRWRAHTGDSIDVAVARAQATHMVSQALDAGARIDDINAQLATLDGNDCPGLLYFFGVGPLTAAMILCAYSHKGRVRTEAAFASLAGIAPIPASSGNTVRWQLNRFGDLAPNEAIDTIVRVRIMHEE